MDETQVRTLEFLAQEYDYGRGSLHAHKVAGLATSLFDQLSGHDMLPGLTLADRRTLVAAAYVHDIGVAPEAQGQIGSTPDWVFRNSPPERLGPLSLLVLQRRLDSPSSPLLLNPLTSQSRSNLLYCVLWHTTTSTYAVDTEPLVNPDKAMLLAGILRVADALDFRLRLRVRDTQVQKASAWLRLLVRTLGPAREEIARAQERVDLLASALGLRVFVQEIIQE